MAAVAFVMGVYNDNTAIPYVGAVLAFGGIVVLYDRRRKKLIPSRLPVDDPARPMSEPPPTEPTGARVYWIFGLALIALLVGVSGSIELRTNSTANTFIGLVLAVVGIVLVLQYRRWWPRGR